MAPVSMTRQNRARLVGLSDEEWAYLGASVAGEAVGRIISFHAEGCHVDSRHAICTCRPLELRHGGKA